MFKKDDILTFSLEIEKLVKNTKMSYIDAVISYCDKSGLELETASKLVNGTLKSKLQIEAENLHFLEKKTTRKLPI